MFKLALASLRFRLAASSATFVAVLLGCAILVICGGIFETALRLNAPPTRLAGVPIVATNATGYRLGNSPEVIPYSERTHLPAGLAGKLQKVKGVQKVIPDVSFSAVLTKHTDTTNGGQFGHAWQSAALTPYSIKSGQSPQKNQVVIDDLLAEQTKLRTGSHVSITVGGHIREFEISGIVQADHTTATPVLFFADSDVTAFVPQKQQVNAFGIFPEPGVSAAELSQQIHKVLPTDAAVLTGDDRGMAEYTGVAGSRLPLLLLGGVFSGMVMVVMALIISTTIGLAVRQRHQELALLRASGATPRKVQHMVVIETMLVGILAIAAGVWVGDWASGWFFSNLAQQGLVSSALVFQHGIIPLAGSALVALLIVWITAVAAAASAAQIQPIQAIVEAALPTNKVGMARRWLAAIFALATLGLASATLFMNADTAAAVGGPAVLTGAIAVGLFAPDLLYRLAKWLSKRRIGNGIEILANKNVRSRAAQFAGVLTPLTLAVAIALGNVYSQTSQQHAILQNYTKQFEIDAVVSSESGGLNADNLHIIRQKSDAQVSALTISQGWIEKPYDKSHTSDPWRFIGIDAQAGSEAMLATPVSAGSLSKLRGNTVALPQGQARALGLGVGSSVRLRLGDGSQITTKVVALLDAPADYASIVVPAELLASHTSNGLAQYALIKNTSDIPQKQFMAKLQKDLQSEPNLQVGSRQVLTNSMVDGLGVQAWINYLVAGLAVAYAAIATINALVVIVSGRRKEFAMQRLLGATRQQIGRMMLFESLIVAGIALILGAIVSVFTIEPMAVAAGLIVPAGSILITIGVILAVLLMVVPVTSIVTRIVTKQRTIDSLNSDA
jgi:putative ABC transport system permease protein